MNQKEKRAEHNKRVLARVFDKDDDLRNYDHFDSFFPPRQIIKKDEKELARIYGNVDNSKRVK